jgi:hypothetical protein
MATVCRTFAKSSIDKKVDWGGNVIGAQNYGTKRMPEGADGNVIFLPRICVCVYARWTLWNFLSKCMLCR